MMGRFHISIEKVDNGFIVYGINNDHPCGSIPTNTMVADDEATAKRHARKLATTYINEIVDGTALF